MSVTARPAADPATDARLMLRAISLASAGWGRVQPNPLVGAVVTDADGRVVGEGAHAEYGSAHAEVIALAAAGERARGGTLYVTLEPCAHHGKTPPCTDAVLRSGVARVVVALRDPNPVASGGIERLAAAGLDVSVGAAERQAADVNAAFLHWHRTGTPWVALKLAVSLDSRISEPGHRTALTGDAAAAEVHRLRAGFDAIMVGGRTARIDDPLLTVRGTLRPRRVPVRVVVDPDLVLSPDARLVTGTDDAPTWVFAAPDAAGNGAPLEARGVRVARARRARAGGLDLHDVLAGLAAHDVRSVLCEGGGRLGAALLSAGLVSRLYLFIAPVLLGAPATPAFPGIEGATNRSWRLLRSERFGSDVLLELAAT